MLHITHYLSLQDQVELSEVIPQGWDRFGYYGYFSSHEGPRGGLVLHWFTKTLNEVTCDNCDARPPESWIYMRTFGRHAACVNIVWCYKCTLCRPDQHYNDDLSKFSLMSRCDHRSLRSQDNIDGLVFSRVISPEKYIASLFSVREIVCKVNSHIYTCEHCFFTGLKEPKCHCAITKQRLELTYHITKHILPTELRAILYALEVMTMKGVIVHLPTCQYG